MKGLALLGTLLNALQAYKHTVTIADKTDVAEEAAM